MSTPGPIRVHRIVKPRHEAGAWSGEGASEHGGRWNHPGTPCVYCGGSLSLAALEMLVHLEAADILNAYRTAWIQLDEAQIRDFAAEDLPVGWDQEPATHASRDLGTQWLHGARRSRSACPAPWCAWSGTSC